VYKRQEVYVPQKLVRNVRRFVIAAGLRRTVAREMFGAGEYTIGTAQLRALQSAHLRRGDGGTEIGVFPRAFDETCLLYTSRCV